MNDLSSAKVSKSCENQFVRVLIFHPKSPRSLKEICLQKKKMHNITLFIWRNLPQNFHYLHILSIFSRWEKSHLCHYMLRISDLRTLVKPKCQMNSQVSANKTVWNINLRMCLEDIIFLNLNILQSVNMIIFLSAKSLFQSLSLCTRSVSWLRLWCGAQCPTHHLQRYCLWFSCVFMYQWGCLWV